MSLQPSDPATDAFERLRLEIALLRRAVEGLAAEREQPAPDYSPTLAALKKSLTQVEATLAALSERPALVLGPEHLGPLLHQVAGRLLEKPMAELERDRNVLVQATEALRVAHQTDGRRSRWWRRWAAIASASAVGGILLWALLLGPVVRTLPPRWAVPEHLAAAILALPMDDAGARLLQRGDPAAWEALEVVRRLPNGAMADLRRCAGPPAAGKASRTCTLKLG